MPELQKALRQVAKVIEAPLEVIRSPKSIGNEPKRYAALSGGLSVTVGVSDKQGRSKTITLN